MNTSQKLTYLLVISIVMNVFYTYIIWSQHHQQKMVKMHYEEKFRKDVSETVVGVYYGDLFCVWVEGRNYAEVMETCNHEWLHHVWSKEHFRK